VKRGLVAAPGDYRWSSFNHYASGVQGVVEIESAWTAWLRSDAFAAIIQCAARRFLLTHGGCRVDTRLP